MCESVRNCAYVRVIGSKHMVFESFHVWISLLGGGTPLTPVFISGNVGATCRPPAASCTSRTFRCIGYRVSDPGPVRGWTCWKRFGCIGPNLNRTWTFARGSNLRPLWTNAVGQKVVGQIRNAILGNWWSEKVDIETCCWGWKEMLEHWSSQRWNCSLEKLFSGQAEIENRKCSMEYGDEKEIQQNSLTRDVEKVGQSTFRWLVKPTPVKL